MTQSSEATERDLVRELARQVAELAAAPENAAIQRRWRDVNERRRPDRPPVWLRPVAVWKEILPDDTLVCRDPWLRSLEKNFRQTLHKRDIGDDTPIDPWLPVPAAFTADPPNLWGVDIRRHEAAAEGGAWAYDPPLVSPDDLDKMATPRFAFDEAETERRLDRAHDLLGDLLPPRLECRPPFLDRFCQTAALLMGLEPLMLNSLVAPDFVHGVMARLRDTALGAIDVAEATGRLSPNHFGPMNASDPIGEPRPDGSYTLKNCWVMANSQEFDQMSPEMLREFLLDYQRPVFERAGRVGFGCCEDLTRKIDAVLAIPNLSLFVCSAWTDLDAVIEAVGDRHTIMWRQKASDVVFPDDTAAIRRHLDDGLRRLRGCHVQVVLRELQTLAGHPRRLHEWTRIAIEMAARHA